MVEDIIEPDVVLGRDSLIAQIRSSHMQSFLLLGPPGVGKRFLVRNIALEKAHPTEIVEKTGRLTIQEVRDLREDLLRRPMSGNFKIAIIELDELSWTNCNVLLKLIEEPPSYLITYLIASTTQFPATLRSRCATFFISPLPLSIMREILIRRGMDTMQATLLATRSRGSFATLDQLDPSSLEKVLSWTNTLTTSTSTDILRQVEKWGQEDFENLMFHILLDPELNKEDKLLNWERVSILLRLVGSRVRPTLKMALATELLTKK